MTSKYRIASFLFLAVAVQHLCHAQAPAPRSISRDELRVCMNTEAELAYRRQATEGRARQNNEEAAAIRAESAQLTEEHKRFGDDPMRVERLNRRLQAHNARVKAANDSVAALRAELEALNNAVVAYNGKCAGVAFKDEDRDAILKERAGRQ